MSLGVPELIILAVFVVPVVVAAVFVVKLLRRQQLKAMGGGYSSLSAYMRAAPRMLLYLVGLLAPLRSGSGTRSVVLPET